MRVTKVFAIAFVVGVTLLSGAIRAEEAEGAATTSTGTKIEPEDMEKFEFQAEVSRLMDIIINSLYQNKDIFLRELISNGSDALDKIRFMSLSDPELLGDGPEKNLEMRISFNKEERSITLRDTGIGMTREDLIQNLGTVAKSGTTQFVEAMAGGGGDMSLIGQFGVGFYSVYLVADRVQVTSKHADDEQHVWISTADSTFSVAADPEGNTLGRGTEIKLFLKEDAEEFCDQKKLQALVKRYSEFITFPIYLHKFKSETVEVPADESAEEVEDNYTEESTPEEGEEDEEELEGDEEYDEEEDDDMVTKTITTWDWEQINSQQAIWTRSSDEITDEEYNEFYKALSKDFDAPLVHTHFRAEGEIEFRSILFVPARVDPTSYENYYHKSSSLKLYVRKVLIQDEFEDLLPRYLNFIRGVVDSDDLPLNVSRETLQQHKVLKVMGKKLVRKVLDMLRKMASAEVAEEDASEEEAGSEDDEPAEKKIGQYTKFWKEFGKNIKLGLIEDSSNRSKLAKLLRFASTRDMDGIQEISLDRYVKDMKEWQKHIYYIAGESLDHVKDSPFLERALTKGVEVLFMTDPIDEYAVQNLPEYDGKKLMSVSKEGLLFGDETEDDKKREHLYTEKFKPLTDWMLTLFGKKRTEKIIVSSRVTRTPAVIVTAQYGYSANMERIMKSQAFGDSKQTGHMASKKTLEINPRHPIVLKLLNVVAEDPESRVAKDLANVMLDTAMINSGFEIGNTKAFARRMYRLIKNGLGLESLELSEEIAIPVYDEVEVDSADVELEDEEQEVTELNDGEDIDDGQGEHNEL